MSFVFWQFFNDFRLATFSTESTNEPTFDLTSPAWVSDVSRSDVRGAAVCRDVLLNIADSMISAITTAVSNQVKMCG